MLRLPDLEEVDILTVREAIANVSRQNREWQQARSQVAQIDATRLGCPSPVTVLECLKCRRIPLAVRGRTLVAVQQQKKRVQRCRPNWR